MKNDKAKPLTMTSLNRFNEWFDADSELYEARLALRQAQWAGDVEAAMIDRVRKAEADELAARLAHDEVSSTSIAQIKREAR